MRVMQDGTVAELNLNRVGNWDVLEHCGDDLEEGRRVASLIVGRQGRNDSNLQSETLRRDKTATIRRLCKARSSCYGFFSTRPSVARSC